MTKIDKFEHILDLEFEAKSARASVELQLAGVPLYLQEQRAQAARRAKDALYAALDALTPEEHAAYGPYRLAVKREYAGRVQ